MRKLAEPDSPEWEKEKEFYLHSTYIERIEHALQLGYKNIASYRDRMLRDGVPSPSNSRSSVPPAPSPKEKPTIMPIPKIELRLPPVQEEREQDEEQLALISDEQIGLKTKTYNSKVVSKRYLRLYNAICRFADIHRKFCPVKKLNIFKLGDTLHGELIGKQIMLDELDITLREQKILAVAEMANLLINACQWYEKIDVECVSGNHGVMGKQFSQTTHWELEFYDLLKATLINYPQVSINVVADDFYFIKKIKNTKFLGLHGDKIPMYLSLPFYGIDRRSLRWKQSLPNWDILTMGHFHTCSFFQASGIPIFINGTMSSDSRFVAQWLGIREIAEMWTMFVGEKYGITAMHKIDLMREEG